MIKESPGELWAAFGERLRHFVGARVRHRHDAEDILQDVFAKIHEGLGSVETPEKLEAWLFQVTRRAIIDHYRSRSARPRSSGLPLEPAAETSTPNATAEVASCLRPLMEELPAPDREVLELADVQGIGQKEVAVKLGLSLTGTKSRVQRARRRLKQILLECCDVEMDRRGNALAYSPRHATCSSVSCR